MADPVTEKRWARADKWLMWGASEGDRELLSSIAETEDAEELSGRIPEIRASIEGSDSPEELPWRLNRLHGLAASRLRHLGGREQLERMLDETPGVRHHAAIALAQLGDPASAPTLAGLLDEDDSTLLLHVTSALGELRYRPAIPRLLELLDAKSAATKMGAARALSLIGDTSVEPALRRARRREWRPWVRFSLPRRVVPDPAG